MANGYGGGGGVLLTGMEGVAGVWFMKEGCNHWRIYCI